MGILYDFTKNKIGKFQKSIGVSDYIMMMNR